MIIFPTANTADCGGWIIAIKLSTSNVPKLLILKVPPEYSSLRNDPFLDLAIKSLVAIAMSSKLLFLQSRIAGMISPLVWLIAIPILIWLCC